MRKTLLVGLAAMFGVVAAAPATASASTKPTLADILLSDAKKDNANGFDKRWYDYDIVTQAVLAFPDLTAAAADPNASLTVFLPKDYAFFRLAKELGAPKGNEEATFNWLVANVGLDTIKNVLMYHIVPGAKINYATALGADGAMLGTLLDPAATIEVDV
ncbi:MAG: fasciclin domain-containing protein, partial [Propionibacteriaceae bacterium]|nr:fasciclin domain-containing protein [Propionibacteriaceae bacterium]